MDAKEVAKVENALKRGAVVVVELYEPHEMAAVRVGKHHLAYGNYWDFHPGCAGLGAWGDYDRPWSLAQLLSRRAEELTGQTAEVRTIKRKRPFPL